MKNRILLTVFLSLLACRLNAYTENIPEPLRPFLDPSPDDKATLIATAAEKDTTYYLIQEADDQTGGQKLISQKDGEKPRLVAMDTFLFPMGPYGLSLQTIQKMAAAYVAYKIGSTPGGKEILQERFDRSPISPLEWLPEEIQTAYSKAGIRFKTAP